MTKTLKRLLKLIMNQMTMITTMTMTKMIIVQPVVIKPFTRLRKVVASVTSMDCSSYTNNRRFVNGVGTMGKCEICGREAGMYQLCEDCHNAEIAASKEAGMSPTENEDLEREHGYVHITDDDVYYARQQAHKRAFWHPDDDDVNNW
jgi:hypothetical protein